MPWAWSRWFTSQMTGALPFANFPESIAITPDGATAYVTDEGKTVTPITIATNALGPPITLSSGTCCDSAWIAITPLAVNGRDTAASVGCLPAGVPPGSRQHAPRPSPTSAPAPPRLRADRRLSRRQDPSIQQRSHIPERRHRDHHHCDQMRAEQRPHRAEHDLRGDGHRRRRRHAGPPNGERQPRLQQEREVRRRQTVRDRSHRQLPSHLHADRGWKRTTAGSPCTLTGSGASTSCQVTYTPGR